MAPVKVTKGRSRLSAAFDDVFEKKGKANEAGIKKAILRAATRHRRASVGQGKYKCILCNKGFSRRATVFDNHFALCVRKNGNPNRYAWDEDPSCWKRNQGPSGVFAPGLDLDNQPLNRDGSGKIDEYNLAMTNYFVKHKEHLDSPQDAVFGFVEVDANGARIEDARVADAEEEMDHTEGEIDYDEADMDLASELSPASIFVQDVVPDSAFFVKGNPVLIAQTATRIPEAAVQGPKVAAKDPQMAAKVVRQEIEVPASECEVTASGKRVCKDMDARGLLTTYEVAPGYENIDPRLLGSRKYPNMSSASGFAFVSFRYMIGNPSKAVHHALHGRQPVKGFKGRISDETMHKVTNLVIDACRARAAFSNEDATQIFNFFRDEVTKKFNKIQYKYHPHKPAVSFKGIKSLQALPLTPDLGAPHRVQATTYMVQDVYGLMLKRSDTLMQQMQVICLWRDVLSTLGAHVGVLNVHALLNRELGEVTPMLLEAVEKFGNVF